MFFGIRDRGIHTWFAALRNDDTVIGQNAVISSTGAFRQVPTSEMEIGTDIASLIHCRTYLYFPSVEDARSLPLSPRTNIHISDRTLSSLSNHLPYVNVTLTKNRQIQGPLRWYPCVRFQGFHPEARVPSRRGRLRFRASLRGSA